MAELREVKRIRATLKEGMAAVPDLRGVRDCRRHEQEIVFEYVGPLPDLLGWLSRHEVMDLKIEPLGLAKIYHRFHGTEE
jgi:hypothetical protein